MPAPWDAFGNLGGWTVPADAANVLLGGIPADVRAIFVRDVDWDPLLLAATELENMAATGDALRQRLDNQVAAVSTSWSGAGFDAFMLDFWLPLRGDLLTMVSQLHSGAAAIRGIAAQAAQLHLLKVMTAIEAIQRQLWLMAIGMILGGPEVSMMITQMVAGDAARLGLSTVATMVSALTDVGSTFLQRAIASFLVSSTLTLPLNLANGIVNLTNPISNSTTLAPHRY